MKLLQYAPNGKLLPLIPINNQRIPLKGWIWAELARAGTDYVKPYRQLLENNYDSTIRMEKEIYGFAVIPANLNLAVIDFDFDDEESIHRARDYVRRNQVSSHSIIKTPNGIHIWSKVKEKNEYDLPALIARKYKIPEVKYRCPVLLPGSKRKKKTIRWSMFMPMQAEPIRKRSCF